MATYKNEIKSVFENDICIGFIARSSLIRGCVQGVATGWIVIQNFSGFSEWHGNYPTRKEAVAALKSERNSNI